jgi:translation initiation factor 2A
MSGPLEPAPKASIAVAATPAPKPAAAGGAYRPPHARGTLTPTVYKREDEGGAAYSGSNGANLFPHSQSANGAGSGGFGQRGRRNIPGAPPGAGQGDDPLANRRKKKGGKKGQQADGASASDSAPGSGAATPQPAAPPVPEPAPKAAQEATLSPEDKKRRAIIKKLNAIEQLKVKKAAGEKLELTQHKKLENEAELRKELEALGGSK